MSQGKQFLATTAALGTAFILVGPSTQMNNTKLFSIVDFSVGHNSALLIFAQHQCCSLVWQHRTEMVFSLVIGVFTRWVVIGVNFNYNLHFTSSGFKFQSFSKAFRKSFWSRFSQHHQTPKSTISTPNFS